MLWIPLLYVNCKINSLVLSFLMLCSSDCLCWVGTKPWLCENTITWASWILIPEGLCWDEVSASFLVLASVTIRPSSVNPETFHNSLNHSYTNQFYVDEGQIHLHPSSKSYFLYPFCRVNDRLVASVEEWPLLEPWHYSGRAMGWTLEGTAESFGRARQANWSGKLWGQH